MPFGLTNNELMSGGQPAPAPASDNTDLIRRVIAAMRANPTLASLPQQQQQQQPATQPQSQPQASQAQAPQSYNDYSKGLVDAATADEHAHPSSLFSWISGAGRDAAAAKAKAISPDAYQAYIQSQNAAQAGAVNNANAFAQGRAMTGVDVDPNNPSASIPALAEAYRRVLAPTQGGSATDGAAAPSGNPIDQQRSFYLRMGRLMQMGGNAGAAKDYYSLASQGAPAGTVVNPIDGSLVDANSGAPISGSVQDYNARGAGLTSAAENAPRVQGTLITQGNQAGLDRETTRQANADKARYESVTGFDKTTGQPITVARSDLVNGKAPNFVEGANPYFAGQQDELKALRTDSQSADNGLNLAQEVVGAANGIYTGKGAGTLQDARKLAQAAAGLTGTKLPDSVANSTSQFEQLQFASQQLVAAAAHDLSPRVAQQIYNQIAAVKPGDRTSVQGLRDIITNQIVPVLARRRALYGATSNYYRKNPTRNDAAAVLQEQLPTSRFSVKNNLNDVQPGEFFINPMTGDLQQRPAQ